MKTMYIILTSLILISSVPCCAEWQKSSEVVKGMDMEERQEYLSKLNTEFVIAMTQPKQGLKLIAIDGLSFLDLSSENPTEGFKSSATLRYLNGKVDYILSLFKSEWSGSGSLYLNLLDEDEFLVESKFISRIAEEYTGDLFGNFNMTPEKFKQIKYYRLSQRT